MKHKLIKFRWSSFTLFSALISSSLLANAEATFQKDENQFINIGTAFRASFSSISDKAPNGKDRSSDFEVEEARLYTNGKVHKNIDFELNLARNSTNDNVEVLDAHVGLLLNNYFNIWIGRFLPPASRASASAPAYPPTFDFPIAEQYPNQFGGRDDGATLWGATENQALKYQFGAFKGRQGATTSNQTDSLSYAARLQYNFWDAEPGFYNLASYDGAKSILSVGGSIRYQKDGAGTILKPGDYRYWNLDARLEKPLEDGAVVGAEASYYDYDNADTNDATAPQGTGYFVTGSYTFPQVIGIGKIQPKFVIQEFDNQSTSNDIRRYDLGASYLINGSSNTRIDAFYFKQNADLKADDYDGVKILFHVAHFF